MSAPPTLVFFGDSLTAGYGIAETSAFPALVQNLLREDRLEWNVVNAGISGDTTQSGVSRLNWMLRSKPAIVFVALGANDGLRGLDPSLTKKNLEKIIAALQKSNVKVVLAGMQLPLNYGESYDKKFRDLFFELARKYKAPIYPFLLEGVAAKPEYNLPDGIHPNEKGHEIIAANVYRFLKPILIKEKR